MNKYQKLLYNAIFSDEFQKTVTKCCVLSLRQHGINITEEEFEKSINENNI